ncbi:hypothetical protein SLS62_008084 [Diatrype stigma]|uniref:Uncharacterized protein n=1 Tax=Diatrype stigma TaxID=117547 RepID=A0AAN9YQ51_9PEZI
MGYDEETGGGNNRKNKSNLRLCLTDIKHGHPGEGPGFIFISIIRLPFQLGLPAILGFVLATITRAFFGDGNQQSLPRVAIGVWCLAWVSPFYVFLVWYHFTNSAANLGANLGGAHNKKKVWRHVAWRYAVGDGVAAVAWIAVTLLMVRYVWSFRNTFTFAVNPGAGGNAFSGCDGRHLRSGGMSLYSEPNPDLRQPFDAWPAEQICSLARAFKLVFLLCVAISVLFVVTALFYLFCIPAVTSGLRTGCKRLSDWLKSLLSRIADATTSCTWPERE